MAWLDMLKRTPPKLVQYISRKETFARMKAVGCTIPLVGDNHFIRPSDDEVMGKTLESGVRDMTHVPDSNDCDNRALKLAAHVSGLGWCFGEAWGIWEKSQGMHAVCWYINDQDELIWLEPHGYHRLGEPLKVLMMKVC